MGVQVVQDQLLMALAALQTSTCVHRDRRLREEDCKLCPELQLAASHSPGVKRLVPVGPQRKK